MDNQQAQTNMQIEWRGMPEDKRWPGFTAIVARYTTKEGKAATVAWFNRLTEQKPPTSISGIPFTFKSAKLVEETPNSGYIQTEYVHADVEAEDEKVHHLALSSNRGRYAIDDADGMDLRSGTPLMIKLGGMWIKGKIGHERDGYFFEADDGTCCGLTSGMQIRLA